MNSFDFLFEEQNRIDESFSRGEYLYRNGSPALGIFFIRSGSVQVIYQTDEGFLEQEIKTAGEILAWDEMDLYSYVSDAVALEDTDVYFIDRYLLKKMLEGYDGHFIG